MLNLKYKLGELNPQFLRELKGRFKTRNILLAVSISLLGQFILLMYFLAQLPQSPITSPHDHYCTGGMQYRLPLCVMDSYNNVIINWELWYQDIFNLLSLLGIFALLVGGIYLLINDLSTEQRRDTLNFIRLSPQAPQSILFGKMLGVPIILYVVIFLAIPFHLWSGVNGKIPLDQILIFYVILLAAILLYYSGALLFSFVGSWLGGFQSWLGSAFILGFLLFSEQAIKHHTTASSPLIVLSLISPSSFIPHISTSSKLPGFHWFGLPLGDSFVITASFILLVYFIASYFIWQSLQRCYSDPNATMLSKKQSYLLTTSFTVIILGCPTWPNVVYKNSSLLVVQENLALLIILYMGLFLYLIAALMPNRKTLQDWARYRHIYAAKNSGKGKLIKDLIRGEKSPGILAIAINGLIAITSISVFISIQPIDVFHKITAFAALIFAFSLLMIYAALAQLLLFMKNDLKLLWTNGIMVAVIILPPIVLFLLFSHTGNQTFLWLFSIAAPIIFLQLPTNTSLSAMSSFVAILGHAGILGLLLFQTQRQLQKAGESATKALLTPN
ncbi:hypothetical protein [Nodularia sp. NIES-3585]|uniref:hypothetical protein n=1 Tax=Nodularia sp. NIES-3585 TaxID=1973477 RepID=UPI000B5CD992|nr:hypothetical protein [Nodularia sp. NIES-3585]GAX38081.1 hypothetical protein NIES3585_41280 [Nodularia sp. NIES-3585]